MNKNLSFSLQNYDQQNANWPQTGQHILAQFDDHLIRVYQAYSPEIADFAVREQRFGGAFSYNRMSWIKPNFLWMMYRSGWASKTGQERILALNLPREFFDQLLARAVVSQFDPKRYPDQESWRAAVQNSDVRLQWDPDHAPDGKALSRRAIQLGLRGETLREYGQQQIVKITDITDLVIQERENIGTEKLQTPFERIYQPALPQAWENADIHKFSP